MKRSFAWNLPRFGWLAAAIVSLAIGCVAMAQDNASPSGTDVQKIASDDVASCMGCHTEDMSFSIRAVNEKGLAASPHKDMKCQDCHTSVDGAPHTAPMMKEKAACADCHSEEAEAFNKSAHAKADKEKGDHPTCQTCHGNDDPHAIRSMKAVTRMDQVAMCSRCHSDTERMKRYNVDPDAVPSYQESFHGKAILRFQDQRAAICVDCHGAHVMLSPMDPKSNVNRANADNICSKPQCHPGAKANFAMSGANHMRLKMKENTVLLGIYYFFRILTFCMIAFMLMGVGLDLRHKVFGETRPKSGRLVGFTISLAYILGIAALAMGMYSFTNAAATTGVVAMLLLVGAYASYFLRRKQFVSEKHEGPKYQRFTLVHRIQHVMLMVCFTTLILTGLPMRFYNVEWLSRVYVVFGGLPGARHAHRIAAIGLIAVFAWHTSELLIRWAMNGFRLRALTMLPNRKDAADFAQHFGHYFSEKHQEPRFDKFNFKQKMDYLAEYWGIPLMVVTGFIQWFPIYWGNRMPEIGLSAAAVAHSWEATLAFLAIIIWHMYNEHLTPDNFPMNKVWITGTLTREEMEREQPLQLERIDAANAPTEPEPEVELEPVAVIEAESTEPEEDPAPT